MLLCWCFQASHVDSKILLLVPGAVSRLILLFPVDCCWFQMTVTGSWHITTPSRFVLFFQAIIAALTRVVALFSGVLLLSGHFNCFQVSVVASRMVFLFPDALLSRRKLQFSSLSWCFQTSVVAFRCVPLFPSDCCCCQASFCRFQTPVVASK